MVAGHILTYIMGGGAFGPFVGPALKQSILAPYCLGPFVSLYSDYFIFFYFGKLLVNH